MTAWGQRRMDRDPRQHEAEAMDGRRSLVIENQDERPEE
jgi:hypothetical protein